MNTEQGKQGVINLVNFPQKAVRDVQVKLKELENGYKSWLAKQSWPVEAAVVTATNAVNGAAIGGLLGTLTNDLSSSLPTPPPQASLNPDAMAPFKQVQAVAGSPLVQARNFAVVTGVNAGINCVMKRLRGKEDLQSSVVAAFGSGAAFSLVSGIGGANPAANAISSGFFLALIQAGSYKISEKWQSSHRPPADDVYYSKTRGMLNELGLQKYAKNFRDGLLTDKTLPLLTDSALRDVRIPPGPRLLILDHIERDPELKKSR
ncbi:Mitochondrial import inner membrane translocase subunit TIM22 [Melia azedarach]|uniref:Mitochondrial import inner membrane translocase subunit TIM22 n=1 Tax=Melia azedarach TaxID=155640 RepID=A0ACC1YSI0_MELAZ|nr:Mitochondrial import inner membrane translocase subunit TIM22 [Melia azedarach]